MDDRFASQPVARWYMPAAVASLLFMLLGCAVYLLGVTTDPATLPLDQRPAQEAQPLWLTSAFAVAVCVGALGALLLVLRRKLYERLLLISLIATTIWFVGLFVAPGLRDLLTTDDYAVGIVVTLVAWTVYWFARHSRQRGWLR
jgi:putative Mn2+ efflux pump MntP